MSAVRVQSGELRASLPRSDGEDDNLIGGREQMRRVIRNPCTSARETMFTLLLTLLPA